MPSDGFAKADKGFDRLTGSEFLVSVRCLETHFLKHLSSGEESAAWRRPRESGN